MKVAKKVFIHTMGCAMNTRDSDHMLAELESKEGFTSTNEARDADLILINTCSVREKPVSKLFSELGTFKKIKKDKTKIGVCGCTASHLGKEIISKAPFVDFVLGARNISKISEVLHQPKAVAIDLDFDDSNYQFAELQQSSLRKYINISIGCDKACTYCIVPHTRGKEISVPLKLILQEANRAVINGSKEIYLLGQNVNDYGKRFSTTHEEINFSKLLNILAEIDGLERIRFTSPHPFHADDEFLETFANNPKVCKHMHLPLQSGSTKVLKAMKRGYSKQWYLDKAFKLKDLSPEVTLSTDIIVGFPGETFNDFEDTMDVVRQVKFEQVFSFKYSPRPLTKAANFTDQVPEDIASERLARLQNLHKANHYANMQDQVGKSLNVMFEELKSHGRIFGKSDNFFNVVIDGSESLLGEIVNVNITGVYKGALFGVLQTQAA